MRVLIVEDDFLIAGDLELKLNDLGCSEVYIAYDLSEAEKFLDIMTPDFALLDVNIGKHLVFPVAAKLLERKVPIIFSTGLPRNSFPPEWQSHPVIPKPLDHHLLVNTLAGLGLRRPASE